MYMNKVKTGKEANRYIHGDRRTKFYHTWGNVKNRVLNKNTGDYKYYGERGISISDDWLEYLNFKRDMYESYLEHRKDHGQNNTTLERIDNDKDYCKENCKWATRYEQAQNRRNSMAFSFNGKTQSLGAWAKELDVRYYTLWSRMNLYGWSVEKTLGAPNDKRFARKFVKLKQ